jgi:hypothetical protein
LLGIAKGGLAWPVIQLTGMIASWFRIVIETLGSIPMAAVVTPDFPSRWLAAATFLNGGVLVGIRLRQFFWQQRLWALFSAVGVIVAALLLIRARWSHSPKSGGVVVAGPTSITAMGIRSRWAKDRRGEESGIAAFLPLTWLSYGR